MCWCSLIYKQTADLCKQKMLNFIDGKNLSKLWKISSDCVQDDHYKLENLISSDEKSRKIGFMAFPVTKPPISITLEFKFKIDINLIKVSIIEMFKIYFKFHLKFLDLRNFIFIKVNKISNFY